MVKGGASPYDPTLAECWNQRRGKNLPPLGRSTLRLLQAQLADIDEVVGGSVAELARKLHDVDRE